LLVVCLSNVTGIHEGKNEICTRIGYFNYGINLKTETPIPRQIRNAVFETIRNPLYKQNVEELNREFATYNPNELFEKHIAGLIHRNEIPEIKPRLLAGKI
jgi:hypothetical protein